MDMERQLYTCAIQKLISFQCVVSRRVVILINIQLLSHYVEDRLCQMLSVRRLRTEVSIDILTFRAEFVGDDTANVEKATALRCFLDLVRSFGFGDAGRFHCEDRCLSGLTH